MFETSFKLLHVSHHQAEKIALDYFNKQGKATVLTGEIDFNFKITTANESYILKISRPDTTSEYLTFQDKLLKHLEANAIDFKHPKSFRNSEGMGVFDYLDEHGHTRKLRLLEWIDGNLYSTINPKRDSLRFSLGQQCGKITRCLLNFDHSLSKRTLDWNLSDALWVEQYLELFSSKEQEIVNFYVQKFKSIQPEYQKLRKSTIHNDANDNNILVSDNLQNPTVHAIIDYGDSVYSQVINDLSVCLAYGIMDFEQPLEASRPIIAGYHEKFPLLDDELKVLYITTAMRLVISVTKSAINKKACK